MTQENKQDDPTLEAVRLLRESGYHEAAADLATKALQRAAAAPAATTATAPPQTQVTRQATADEVAEAERQAEGKWLLGSLRRDVPSIFPEGGTTNDAA